MRKISAMITIVMLVLALSACSNQPVSQPAANSELTLNSILNISSIDRDASIEINHRSFEANDIAILSGEPAAAFINELFSLPLQETKKEEFTPTVFSDIKYSITTGDGQLFEMIDIGAFTIDNGQRYFSIKAGDRPVVSEDSVWNTYAIHDMTSELTLKHTSTQFARNNLEEYFCSLSPEEVDALRRDHQMIHMLLMDSYWNS